MRKIVVVLAVFATLSLAGASPAAAQEPGPVEMEREFVSLINDLRATQGLSALAVHDELVGKARRWSATMAAEGDIWHSDLRDGITVAWRRLGENVGMGGSVRSLHDAFVASPHHYENLVDPGFNYVGLGVVVDPDGTIFVSQEFMELAPAPASASPSPTGPGQHRQRRAGRSFAGPSAGRRFPRSGQPYRGRERRPPIVPDATHHLHDPGAVARLRRGPGPRHGRRPPAKRRRRPRRPSGSGSLKSKRPSSVRAIPASTADPRRITTIRGIGYRHVRP